MSRPSELHTLLEVARVIAERSTCDYAHVGALVVRDGRILSSGFNGAPTRAPHCDHGPREDFKPVSPCTTATHAEANAIAYAARHGVATEGAQMVTTLSPCTSCARLIIAAGINLVWCGQSYRDPAGIGVLAASGVRAVVI